GRAAGGVMITSGWAGPMELGHLPYRKGRTYEEYVGLGGLERLGRKRWRRRVEDVVERLAAALEPDDIVIGGGNAKRLKRVPDGARIVTNRNAFVGGVRLWGKRRAQMDGLLRRRRGEGVEAYERVGDQLGETGASAAGAAR